MKDLTDYQKRALEEHKESLTELGYTHRGEEVKDVIFEVLDTLERRYKFDLEINNDLEDEVESIIHQYTLEKLIELEEFKKVLKSRTLK
jgi:hypothetical protein